MERYRRFHAAVYYFEYAVGTVRSQEAGLRAREGDGMICGNAIAAYIFMHDCFVLLEKAVAGISREPELARKIKRLRKLYEPLGKRVEDIRHALGAHPEGGEPNTEIATKRSMGGSDGRVWIGKFMLHSRKDLEELRQYMERTGELLHTEWSV